MKWIRSKTRLKPDLGKQRVVTKFFWFPTWLPLNGVETYRWLETASVMQEVCQIDVGSSMEWGNYAYCWRDISWVNRPVWELLLRPESVFEGQSD